MTRLVRSALAIAVLLTMLGSAGCGRKAMPEPRKSSSTATLIGARDGPVQE
jgi:predicted small lipoprotein YifL